MKITNRHGHIGPGLCSLTYSSPTSGQKVITCGADNLIKIHDLEREKDEEAVVGESDHFQEAVNAVAASPDGRRIAAGGAGKIVAVFKLPELEFEKNVVRCTLEIKDVCFSPSSDFIAVASEDSVIKIVNVENIEESKNLEGHAGGVRSIAYDPKGTYLASTGCDCTLRIWDVSTSTEKTKINKVYSKEAASGMADGLPKNMCKVAWCGLPQFTQSAGKLLAVAGSKEVRVFERDTWKELESFPSYGQEISIVEFSPNGQYLLTVDTEGEIVVWNVEERQSVARKMNSDKILAAHWDLFMNTISVIAEDGSWGTWNNVVPDKYIGPAQADLAVDEAAASDGEEFDLDDIVAMTTEEPDAAGKHQGNSHRTSTRNAPVHFSAEPQPSFQPQSTKMEHKRRFMAFTSDGFITCRSETVFNAIEIEFADVTVNRPIRFNDYSNFTMAAMGKIAAVFASVGTPGSDDGAAIIHYRPFGSWASNSDWTHNLQPGELVTAVAICDEYAAATTSSRLLRIFSFSGLEKHIYSLPGQAVCMHGRGDLIGCVYHLPSSPSMSGDQELEFQLLDLKAHRLVSRGRLCLSAGAVLEWFQVVRPGLVAAMDSEGIVSVHSPAEMGGQWCPILDIKACNKPRDWFWPISIDEASLTGVVCKIEKRYPDVVQPVVTQFALAAPLLRREAEPQEEQWYRSRLFLSHDERHRAGGGGGGADDDEDDALEERARLLDTSLCRLFDAACKAGKQNRALDLAMAMRSRAAMDVAHKLATMNRLNHLAEKVDILRQVRFAEDDEEEEGGGAGDNAGEEEWEHRAAAAAPAARRYGRGGGGGGESEEGSAPAAKRAKVHFEESEAPGDSDVAEMEGGGGDDDDDSGPAGKGDISTPPGPAPAPRRPQGAAGSGVTFFKKTSDQDAAKGKVSFLDKIQAMRPKPAAELPVKPKAITSFGMGGFSKAKAPKKR